MLKYLFLFTVIFLACSGKTERLRKKVPGKDNNEVEYAKRFILQHRNGYTILSVKDPWQGAVNVVNDYYFVKRGEKAPSEIDSMKVISIPVQKIICMSTTYLSMISILNEDQTVKGISGTDFLYNNDLVRRTENGLINDVGYGDNLNKELVIQISPDLVMAYGIGSESAGYLNKIKDLGIRILFNADYLETDPLGKAEWIKVFGVSIAKRKNPLITSILSPMSTIN